MRRMYVNGGIGTDSGAGEPRRFLTPGGEETGL